MTTQHTPGRLHVNKDVGIYSDKGRLIASVHTPIAQHGNADTRRLVAAWNYVEMLGMSTEEIELSEQPIYSRRKLEKQNAELLEALKRIEGASMSMYATRSDMLEDCQDIARAAIAKAEGGAT